MLKVLVRCLPRRVRGSIGFLLECESPSESGSGLDLLCLSSLPGYGAGGGDEESCADEADDEAEERMGGMDQFGEGEEGIPVTIFGGGLECLSTSSLYSFR